ncbi:hypothetical protein JCM10296v2_004570 [Rhodotorula toruloides]
MQDGRETPYLRPLFAGRTYSESVSVDGLISSRRRRRTLVVVIPPPILLSAFSSSASSFSSAYGPPGRFESGVLMPLQGSLGAQLALTAREYGLPSVAGLSLYLNMPEMTEPSLHAHSYAGPPAKRYAPRLTAETWSTLWSAYLEGTGGEYMSSTAPSLPIAGHIEFDLDLTRATWLRDLVEDVQPRENDWTAQLDRLREISETSMLEGVEHASQLGSFDASGSLGELLMSIVEEERDDDVVPAPADVVDNVGSVEAAGATQLDAPIRPSPSFRLPYPILQPYPPVYPIMNLYPSVERFGTAFERLDEQHDALRAVMDSPEVEVTQNPLVPDIALSLAIESTQFINSYSDLDFPAHLSLDPLQRAAGHASPLPSPTITPASLSRSSISSPSDARDYPVDFDDYTLEVTEALSSTLDYSGELDSPGLDDADDYFVLNAIQVPFDGGSDSESDAASQSSAEEDAAVDSQLGGLVEVDDACRTFDVPSSPLYPSPEPVLFVFPPLARSRDLLDAVALFVLEAQDQSIDRRGIFSVAIGATSGPLSLLQQALEDDARVRWDYWRITCPSGLPACALEAFPAAVPLARIDSGTNAVRIAGGGAGEAGREVRMDSRVDKKASSRFDLVLLDVHQDLGQLEKSNSPAPAPQLLDDLAGKPTNNYFSLSHLATSRRLAYIAIGASQHSSLHNFLSSSDSPARLDLANGHPAVIFAEEDAVGDIDYPHSAFWDGEEEPVDSRAEV